MIPLTVENRQDEEGWAMRSLRSRRSGLLRTEPLRVSALREPAAIAGDSFTLTEAIAACEAAIEANEAAKVDRIGRRILDNLSGTLRRYVRRAQDELAHAPGGNTHLYCANWFGPALADVIASSAFHRIHSAIGKAAA